MVEFASLEIDEELEPFFSAETLEEIVVEFYLLGEFDVCMVREI